MYKGFNLRTSMAAVVASMLMGSALLTSAVSSAVPMPTFHLSAHAVA